MRKNLLLVEDSKEIYQMVSQSIPLNTELTWANSIKAAEDSLNGKVNFDLILLDIELPDGSGIDLCTTIQNKYPMLPIFFLTSHKELSEKVLGFSAGADDYITKPFNSLELKARIEARLKKAELLNSSADILQWQEIEIDKSTQEVTGTFKNEKISIDLTSLEFKLLMYFANRPNHVISRDSILNDIWGEDVHVYARSVDTHVSKLRKKLGPLSHLIESIHGSGYKFLPTPL